MNIHFWIKMPNWRGEQGVPTFAGQVAKFAIGCTLLELCDAFKAWSEAGLPPWFFYPLKAPRGIGINAHGVSEEGWGNVSLYRTWGKTHRQMKHGVFFTLELSVP
jgi:hypothetical protein